MAWKVPPTLASAYVRSPTSTAITVPGGTWSRWATVTYSRLVADGNPFAGLGLLRIAGGVELLDVARCGYGGGRSIADRVRDLAHVLAAHIARNVDAGHVR